MSKRTQRRAEQRRSNREKSAAARLQEGTELASPSSTALDPAPLSPELSKDLNGEQTGAANEAKPLKTAGTGTKAATSPLQIAANRENATHSTGPISDIGKAIVSQNRTVHGLNYNPNTFRVLACEDQAAYDDLLHLLTTDHKPTDTTETLLVTSMAQHRWLLDRANRLQETCFSQETGAIADQKLFTLYLRYATTHERAFHKCLADLLKLRSTRQRLEIGFESEKRRADRHQNFLDRKEINSLLHEMKFLAARTNLHQAGYSYEIEQRSQNAA